MSKRSFPGRHLRKLAIAALAFRAWLDRDITSQAADSSAEEAHRELRALCQSGQSAGTTRIYDAHGRLTQMIDHPPSSPLYSLRLGSNGEIHIHRQTDVYIFVMDEQQRLHYHARTKLPCNPAENE